MEAELIYQEERTLVPDYLRSRPQYQPIYFTLPCPGSCSYIPFPATSPFVEMMFGSIQRYAPTSLPMYIKVRLQVYNNIFTFMYILSPWHECLFLGLHIHLCFHAWVFIFLNSFVHIQLFFNNLYPDQTHKYVLGCVCVHHDCYT